MLNENFSKKNQIPLLLCLIICLAFIPAQVYSQAKVWSAKGEQAFNKKNWDKAIEYFSKSIDKDAGDKYVFYKRGISFLNTMRLDEAVSDFTEAIKLDSNFYDAYNNRGLALSFTDAQQEAIKDFNKVLDNDSTFALAYINRGTCYINLLNYKAAFADFEKAEQLAPENPSIYFQRARAYYRQRKFEEAVKDYSKCIDLGFKNSKVYYSRGNCYYNLNEYQKAVDDYNTAYLTDNTNVEILNNRAVAYDKLGMKDLAKQDRETISQFTGFRFEQIPIDSLIFNTYTSDTTGIYSISLPEGWRTFPFQDTNSTDLLITMDRINKSEDYYNVGVRLSYTKDMKEKFGQESIEDILSFWKGSLTKNSQSYSQYQVFYEKQKQIGVWDRVTRKVRLRFSKDSAPVNMYELALIKPGLILYGFFQAPEQLWDYYEKIYDKAIDSIKIK